MTWYVSGRSDGSRCVISRAHRSTPVISGRMAARALTRTGADKGLSVRDASWRSVRRATMSAVAKPLVVQVITRLIVGGAQFSVLELCRGLREEFDVRVICGADHGAEGSLRDVVSEVAPVTVIPTLRRDVRPGHDVAALLTLKRVLRTSSPAIVHTHSSKAGILGRLAAGHDAKVIHTIHGWGHTPDNPSWMSKLFVGLEQLAAERSDALVAVSADVRDEGVRRGIGGEEKYRVIPELVEFAPISDDFVAARREARRKLGLPDGEEVIGWVGRFVPQKDPETLLGVIERVLKARPNARMVLVGDGPLRIEVESEVARQGNARRTIFTGVRDDARQLYAAFDVIVHVSRWEGQPLVVQEAIAERIPVVATDAEGVKDLVIDGLTGYVVAPGDIHALSEATETILAGSSLRAPLADSAIEDVAEVNGRDIALARHLELYEGLLGLRSAAPLAAA
jgi:glycosyltransferase involved in cell wall biosynthesis